MSPTTPERDGGLKAAPRGGSPWLPVVATVGVLIVTLGLTEVMRTSYDVFVAVLVAAVLFAISLPALHHQAARERDGRLAGLLTVALLAKLAGAVLRYGVAFGLYGGKADALAYWAQGLVIGPGLRHGNFADVHILGLSGSNFVRFLSGVTVAGIGPSLLGGYIVFSWVGFWGLFLFYRAFTIAVPEGRRRLYAYLVFFLPSLIFWPSAVGKESWMVLGLGTCAFGVARVLTGRTLNGMVYAALGLIACAAVRSPIAAMAAVAFTVAMLVRPSRRSLGALGPIMKLLALLPVIVVSVLLVIRAQEFLKASGITTSNGISTVLKQTTARTQKGGSRFVPSVLNAPWLAPIAGVTVLFRPLVYEAKDLQSLGAAFEGSFLIGLCFVRYRWIARAFRLMRERVYITFSIVYIILFIAAYSSIANFGILVRERVQVIPFFLVLLCVPPLPRGGRKKPVRARTRGLKPSPQRSPQSV